MAFEENCQPRADGAIASVSDAVEDKQVLH
jgi:hypothetical protein